MYILISFVGNCVPVESRNNQQQWEWQWHKLLYWQLTADQGTDMFLSSELCPKILMLPRDMAVSSTDQGYNLLEFHYNIHHPWQMKVVMRQLLAKLTFLEWTHKDFPVS